jgi:TonB family protein
VSSALDIYLVTTPLDSISYHVTGTAVMLSSSRDNASALLLNPGQDFELDVSGGVADDVQVADADGQPFVTLRISAVPTREPLPVRRLASRTEFIGRYSMYDRGGKAMVVTNAECTAAIEAAAPCRHRVIRELPGGDIIAYFFEYRLSQGWENDDGSRSFLFEATRLYVRNPKDTSAAPEDMVGDERDVQLFSRSITMHPAERIEINFPENPSSPLGAQIVEMLVLIDPQEFVPVDRYPEMAVTAQPEYPLEAKRQGLEAELWMQVLIDTAGVPIEARVQECSRPGAGFEASALKAAYENRFKPAMREGRPVAVWITYKVSYVLN